jgi:hypothetical protein
VSSIACRLLLLTCEIQQNKLIYSEFNCCCFVSLCAGVRTKLLESPDHSCPDCQASYQSPDRLVPNKYLRQHVTSFLNDTSYIQTRKAAAAAAAVHPQSEPQLLESVIKPEKVATPPPSTSEVKHRQELPAHPIDLPPEVVRVAQMEADHAKSWDTKSPPLQAAPVSHNYQFQPGYTNHTGNNYSSGDQPHASAYQQHAVRHTSDQLISHNEINHGIAVQPPASSHGYQQQQIPGAGTNVGQMYSAPNLPAHPMPTEYVLF